MAARRSYDWGGGTLTREQTAQILYQAGFRGQAIADMVAIAGRESGYRPGAHGTSASRDLVRGDRGLWQINYVNDEGLRRAGIIKNPTDLFNPLTSARAAFFLSSGGRNLNPWRAGPGGFTGSGDPFFGTDRAAANAAVQRAGQQGLLGKNWTPSSSTSTPSTLYPNTTQPPVANQPAASPAERQDFTSILGRLGIKYPNAPSVTPALVAFLRGVNLNLATAEDIRNKALARTDINSASTLADINRASAKGVKAITGDLVGRGVLRSGEANKRYARQASDTAAAISNTTNDAANVRAQTELAYQQSKDALRREAMDRLIGAEVDQRVREEKSKAEAEASRQALAAEQRAATREAEERQREREALGISGGGAV